MKGKVVGIRLSYSQLLGCVDIYELTGGRASSLATCVSTSLDIILGNLRKANKIPTYTDDDAQEILSELFKRIPGKNFVRDLKINLEESDSPVYEPPKPENFIPETFLPPVSEPVQEPSTETQSMCEVIEEEITRTKKEIEDDLLRRLRR